LITDKILKLKDAIILSRQPGSSKMKNQEFVTVEVVYGQPSQYSESPSGIEGYRCICNTNLWGTCTASALTG